MTAESRSRHGLRSGYDPASTEPRSDDRGEAPYASGAREVDPMLQRSRGPMTAERGELGRRYPRRGPASTEPRSDDRGEGRDRTIHRRER